MNYLKPAQFKQLKAFFLALKEGHFKIGSGQNLVTVLVDGIPTPVNKAASLELLRSFPNMSGEEFKNDDFLIRYLSDPVKRNRILGQLPLEQQIELSESLEEKPVITEAVSGQPSGQEAIEQQTTPVGQAAGALAGGIPGIGIPSAPSVSAPPRRVFAVPQASPPGGMEGGAGQGVAATNKIDRLETQRVGAATAKGNRLAAEKPVTRSEPLQSTPSSRRFNFSAFRSSVSSAFKKVQNFASPAGPFFKINSGRVARGLGDIAKGVGRRAVGAAGAGLGAAAPHLGRLGHGVTGGLQSISRPGIGRGGIGKGLSKSSSKFALAFVGAMLLVVFVGAIGGLGGTTPTGEAAPITPASTDISSCKFTRADQPLPAVQFKSPILLGYFQEASQITGVPAALLAAFARIEVPDSVNWTDQNVNTVKCPTSTDYALGIMQLITKYSPRTDAYCDDCIANGLAYLNKTLDAATQADFCDTRSSIIIGAGFFLKKFQLIGLGDGKTWNPQWTTDISYIDKLAHGYYGCGSDPVDYGGAKLCEGPYNYTKDLWTSITNCQVASPVVAPAPTLTSPPANEFALSCPVANENNTCSSYYDKNDPCHCNKDLGYQSMPACEQDASLYYGIDVGTKASSTTLIPYIAYQGETTLQSITCQLIKAQSETCPAAGCQWQQILHYQCPIRGKVIYLQYNHILSRADNDPAKPVTAPPVLSSGQAVGQVAYYQTNLRRLNIQLGIGGECAYNDTTYCVLANEYFQCPLRKEGPD